MCEILLIFIPNGYPKKFPIKNRKVYKEKFNQKN